MRYCFSLQDEREEKENKRVGEEMVGHAHSNMQIEKKSQKTKVWTTKPGAKKKENKQITDMTDVSEGV